MICVKTRRMALSCVSVELTVKKTASVEKNSSQHILSWGIAIHAMENGPSRNSVFYSQCTKYFAALRRKGRSDSGFEDEFFYTIPTMSGIR